MKNILLTIIVLLSCYGMVSCMNCSSSLLTCETQLNNVTLSYATLEYEYGNCTCQPNPCASNTAIVYDMGLHIAAIFIVLVASFFGAFLPIISKRFPQLMLTPYIICLGKCIGSGVVLACGLIHMLQPGSASLTSPCLPWEFNTDYNAYSYLYCMLAGLMMQFLDFLLNALMMRRKAAKEAPSTKLNFSPAPTPAPTPALAPGYSSAPAPTSALEQAHDETPTSAPAPTSALEQAHDETPTPAPAPQEQYIPCGHVHQSFEDIDWSVKKSIEAYLIEFGVTTHSVLIGLAVGVVDESTLKTLLVALVFHQLFEGVALGSRLVDASMSRMNELVLSSIFSVAAPLGIAIGISFWSSFNPGGESFLMIQGTLDSCCGGILIYIGYNLIIVDFPRDMTRHCKDQPHESFMQAGMFAALWLGAGMMAFIGKYL